MKPEELADELDRLLNGPRWSVVDVGVFVHDNRLAILSALCRVEMLEAALQMIIDTRPDDDGSEYHCGYSDAMIDAAGIARQALTGEA